MDTLSHGLAGALLGRAGAKKAVGAAVAAMVVGALFPDVDAFFMPGHWFSLSDTMGYIEYHRGVTHSFLLAPLWALLVAVLVKAFVRTARWTALWVFALAGIVSHILFDWMTSYGTMFFSPLSWHRYQLDWLFILDPYFTGIPLVFLVMLIVWRRKAWARALAGAGSLLFLGYVGFCALQHERALARAREVFPGARRVAALPQPFSPFRWALFDARQDEIDVADVDLGPHARGTATPPEGSPPRTFAGALRRIKSFYVAPGAATALRFSTHLDDPALAAARKFSDVAAWFAFARFPVVAVSKLSDGSSRVVFTDLRFRGPWRTTAFQYEAILSPRGAEISSGFVHLFVVGGKGEMAGRVRHGS